MQTRSLTIIPADRVTHKGSGPNTHRDKEATDGGSDDTDDYNGVLLSRGVGVDNHRGRRRGRSCKATSRRKKCELLVRATRYL